MNRSEGPTTIVERLSEDLDFVHRKCNDLEQQLTAERLENTAKIAAVEQERDDLRQQNARLTARVGVLETALRAARPFLTFLRCGDLHHGKGDYHGGMAECPVEARVISAKRLADEALAGKAVEE